MKQIHSNKVLGWDNILMKIIQIYQRYIMAYKTYFYLSLVGYFSIQNPAKHLRWSIL